MAKVRFTHLFDRIIEGTGFIGGLTVVLMMLHITLDVVLRFFGKPPPGTMSIVSYYYMLVVTFISLAFVERRNSHIAVDILYEFMSPRLKAVCNVISALVCLIVFALMGLKSWEIAVEKFAIQAKFIQGNSVIITWPGYFLLPLGFALTWSVCALKLIKRTDHAPHSVESAEGSMHE